MSEESDFSEDLQVGWIQWFCGLDDHQFFCEVDEDYIADGFNMFGLRKRVNKYDEALKMIMKHSPPDEQQIQTAKFLETYQEATELYGLVHARYITTPQGLAVMRQRFLTGRFGHCPRVMCQKQNVLPIGISEDLKIARVKVYCPRCKDIYSPKKKFADVDGAFFGTSFPQLLLMTYPDIKPLSKKEDFMPTIFGFKILQQGERPDSLENSKLQQIKYLQEHQENQNQNHKELANTEKPKKNNKKKRR